MNKNVRIQYLFNCAYSNCLRNVFGTCVYRKERSIGTEYETVAALATFDD